MDGIKKIKVKVKRSSTVHPFKMSGKSTNKNKYFLINCARCKENYVEVEKVKVEVVLHISR